MKYALIGNNKVIQIANQDQLVLSGWREVPDSTEIGDVFDPSRATREENLLTEMPNIQELVVTLWKSIISGDNTERDTLESKRQAILNKYPKGE